MLDSYFFIPGDKPKYLKKIGELNANFFVIDLEESVSNNNKLQALSNLNKLNVSENTFVRIPFKDNVYSENQIIDLINKFSGRIVLPKVIDSNDLKRIISTHNFTFPLNLIVLVENPICFANISDIIKDNINHLHAIGFGSHDFCSSMGIKHNLKYLSYYKQQLIVLSKAYGINYIDGVDLNIRDLSNFVKECVFAFNAGADGKFILHPDQLEKMEDIKYFSKIEIEKMIEIHEKTSSISSKDIDVIEFEGKIYEKPHLVRIDRLIKKLKRKNH